MKISVDPVSRYLITFDFLKARKCETQGINELLSGLRHLISFRFLKISHLISYLRWKLPCHCFVLRK